MKEIKNSNVHKYLFTLLLITESAFAEPSASTSHIPFLWGGVFILALIAASFPLLYWAQIKPRPAINKFLLISFGFFCFISVFIGPVIIALGSILITGRTM